MLTITTRIARAPYITLRSKAVVLNTTLRAIRRYLLVYLIVANLDGEFPYTVHCLVALRLTPPLSRLERILRKQSLSTQHLLTTYCHQLTQSTHHGREGELVQAY